MTFLKLLALLALLSASPAPRQDAAGQEEDKEEEAPALFQPTESLSVDEAVSFPIDI